jgi:glycosyltransferase involved in cell wall biosynthesis
MAVLSNFIEMQRLLFLTLSSFYPEAGGGSEISMAFLLHKLRKQGWEIEVICKGRKTLWHSWNFMWQCLKGWILSEPLRCFVEERSLGYKCYRQLRGNEGLNHEFKDFFLETLHCFNPTIVTSTTGGGHYQEKIRLLNLAAQQGYPVFLFVRNVDQSGSVGIRAQIPDNIRVIANSPFVASVLSKRNINVAGVVLPLIEKEACQVRNRSRMYITFMNPIREKGVHIAIEVARRMPERRFLFVKGKWAKRAYRREDPYMKLVHGIPNVTVWEFQSDVKRVYQVTDVLLIPSQFLETFCRVIVEAHANGIPTVAADRGGISYTVGSGGILVQETENPDAYVRALKALEDEHLYNKLSHLAYENSSRKEFSPEFQLQTFLDIIESTRLLKH